MQTSSAIEHSFQPLPTNWIGREELRGKGQFWTPDWLAKIMAAWVTEKQPATLFDPAVGPGTFFSAARAAGYTGHFDGFELHEAVFADGEKLGLTRNDFNRIHIADFLSSRFTRTFPAIISNPPYIRHHRLDEKRKSELKTIAERVLGFALDGRVGLHVYFLLKSLEHLSPAGRLAFVLPADVCEGISSRALWNRLCERYRLEAILTFDECAAPFPKVDTNAMVFFMSHSAPCRHLKWLRVKERDVESVLHSLLDAKNGQDAGKAVDCQERELPEALDTGLSRPPRPVASRGIPLSHFARIVRGIATGANEFFFFTREQVKTLGLSPRFFIRAIGRTRDCRGDVLRPSALDQLDLAGRPTWLLNLDNTPKEQLPASLRSHLESGEQQQFHRRSLIQSRRPWYKMEQRTPPPILFAYLGRRDCRFILNEAGVVPLTGFLCIYPWDTNREAVRRLWRALNHPDTQQNLAFAGKSYGGGAVKVEPRQMDTLEIPEPVLREVGLKSPEVATELVLLDRAAGEKSSGKSTLKKRPSG
ncbi:MAG: N-6 DNA methylase [Verrucomicrobia bacterium]|nr:N-6 DNA methylase [Verrucomicrobiota bacterium]MDE3099893.1 N-6 DNA methylase [Verrucomicrobiota bacterium]